MEIYTQWCNKKVSISTPMPYSSHAHKMAKIEKIEPPLAANGSRGAQILSAARENFEVLECSVARMVARTRLHGHACCCLRSAQHGTADGRDSRGSEAAVASSGLAV